MEKITKIFQISVSREMQNLLYLKNIAFTIPCCLEDCWEDIKVQLTPVFNHFKQLDSGCSMKIAYMFVVCELMCPPYAALMAGLVGRKVTMVCHHFPSFVTVRIHTAVTETTWNVCLPYSGTPAVFHRLERSCKPLLQQQFHKSVFWCSYFPGLCFLQSNETIRQVSSC